MMDDKPQLKEVPNTIYDSLQRQFFYRGKFLGKGGFARCYELVNSDTKEVYAGKVVSKLLLQKNHQKEKMTQEIEIHRALSHPHIVRMDGFFEDSDNVYILLELCPRRSLMELYRRRKAVTEPEARYFTSQVVSACDYLHSHCIIHRDLKLGNLFLDDEMQVKVGDFGLATIVDYVGERKKTLCGTPNYIAPEMLDKKGHSYEVDIWSLGCILYTLLVGKPPFETMSLKETYQKIKNNDYVIPKRISPDATHLISCLLAAVPSKRPNIQEVSKFDFFLKGYMPTRLPTSCLTMAPNFTLAQPSQGQNEERRVLAEIKPHHQLSSEQNLQACDADLNSVPSDCYLSDLFRQLDELIIKNPAEKLLIQEDEAEDPACTPVFWISKWVDYSDKYGLGYQLCDNSIGVIYNDNTKLVLNAAGEQVQYTEKDNSEKYFFLWSYPEELHKKITLLKYFRNYMQEHLQKTGPNMAAKEGDELARLPWLRTWFRTRSAIVLHMSNGILQINFFQDHTKLIVCPLMGAVTYIDQQRRFRTFKFELIARFGCSKDVFCRLKYAKSMVEHLLSSSKSLIAVEYKHSSSYISILSSK
ncbi:unnamed protein product [Enterobius vermicularis]|uniref:Serine/threonine-protein kinase PLK n=1 Tax=Enterobius vermicularis TaxID=51028 RepID=A0A0N4VEF2_ENTVE|nr:unnamed protein product [Enterobius vermicularis]